MSCNKIITDIFCVDVTQTYQGPTSDAVLLQVPEDQYAYLSSLNAGNRNASVYHPFLSYRDINGYSFVIETAGVFGGWGTLNVLLNMYLPKNSAILWHLDSGTFPCVVEFAISGYLFTLE